MKTYCVRINGSAGIRSLEFERQEMDDSWLETWARMTLPHYHPVYFRADIWEKSESPEVPGIYVATYHMKVVAVKS